MKFLCDVHLPQRLVRFFTERGMKAIHGSQILNSWHTSDKDFSQFADENDFIFITKDSDFRKSFFIEDSPRKLIKINLGNISNSELILLIEKYLPAIVKAFEENYSYIEINREFINIFKKR